MHLTRLTLNPRNAQARKEIAYPYELHRTLCKAFPGIVFEPNQPSGILFRLDDFSHENRVTVLVQSQTAPEWGFLADKKDGHGQPYLLPAELIPGGKPNPACTEFSLAGKLIPGQTWAFRLRANPTKRLGKSAGEAKQGKRVGIREEEKQIEWLQRKAEAGGFRILQVHTSKDSRLKDEQHQLDLFAVQFDGLLQVTDPALLQQAIVNGIGSAKGFGFGLLSLAPLQ
jgi:CRISPR system Cascade subunit CasE